MELSQLYITDNLRFTTKHVFKHIKSKGGHMNEPPLTELYNK